MIETLYALLFIIIYKDVKKKKKIKTSFKPFYPHCEKLLFSFQSIFLIHQVTRR